MMRTVRPTAAARALTAAATPAIRPPPPMPSNDGVEVGDRVEQLEAERALADDDVAVVERVDEHRAGALGELGGQAQRRLDGRALEHDVGAVAARREQLGHGHARAA